MRAFIVFASSLVAVSESGRAPGGKRRVDRDTSLLRKRELRGQRCGLRRVSCDLSFLRPQRASRGARRAFVGPQERVVADCFLLQASHLPRPEPCRGRGLQRLPAGAADASQPANESADSSVVAFSENATKSGLDGHSGDFAAESAFLSLPASSAIT